MLSRLGLALCILPALHCALPSSDDYTADIAQSQLAANPAAIVTVDCSQVDEAIAHRVTYRRGWVQFVGATADVATQVEAASVIEPNLATAALDLNVRTNEAMFAFDAKTQQLSANPTEPGFLDRLGAVKRGNRPVFVQISGTPAAVPRTWLDTQYQEHETSLPHNYYPLALPERQAAVQAAVVAEIKGIEAANGGNIWIGTQEPTHTLGFLDACVATGLTPADRFACRKTNVDRFISYWKPIATELRRANIKVGGIQLNSHDRDLYTYAADALIASGTPVDYFTIQRYSSYEDIVPEAYAAYQRFHAAPGYENVKIAFTRYGNAFNLGFGTPEAFFGSAKGMIQILADERQIMEHSEMMFGYSYETGGIFEPTSLVPPVMRWLQHAPQPLRPMTLPTGLDGFALVGGGTGSVAVWNKSDRAQSLQITLASARMDFSRKTVTALKGSGTTIAPAPATLTRNVITGVSLAPNEFALISVE